MRLGDAGQAISITGSAAASALPFLTAATWAVPVVGAVTAALTIAWAMFKRRGQQKVAATEIIDQATKTWQNNLDAYRAGPRTAADQAAALKLFDDVWEWVISPQGCGDPDLGAAGHRCIDERKRGGVAPWCPTGAGCDAFIAFRDPIANDSPKANTFFLPADVAPENPGIAGLLIPGLLIAGALAL